MKNLKQTIFDALLEPCFLAMSFYLFLERESTQYVFVFAGPGNDLPLPLLEDHVLPSIEAEIGAGIATSVTKVIKSTPVLPPGSRITPLLSGTKIQSRTPVISTTTDKMPGLKAGVYKIQVKSV